MGINTKICKDCLFEKDISFYYKRKDVINGISSYCKDCHNIRNKKASKKWLSTDAGKQYMRDYSAKVRSNPRWADYIRNYSKQYQKSEKGLAQRRIIDARKRNNPEFKIHSNMSRALRFALNGRKNEQKWTSLVGYSLKELVNHLEKQFDSKMSWNNYGSYWHIDHIKPRSSFMYSSYEDDSFKSCWALSNLQPLEAIENIKKSNKII